MTDQKLPDFFRVRQSLPSHPVADVSAAAKEALQESKLDELIRPQQTVAIAVGSRGIRNLKPIVEAVAQHVLDAGGKPVIVPAMGSHGGATAAGQTAVLKGFGISEDAIGCPIDADMSTVYVGDALDEVPVFFSRTCRDADHVLLINRIKPHTRLVGPVQSGLSKMLVIGLGKRDGPAAYHRAFPVVDYVFERIASRVVPLLIREMPVTLGIAIVEDALEQTSLIEAVRPQEFLSREPELLRIASERMPQLPFDRADLLIVDKMGKEISGTGMDTNVVGRKANDRAAGPDEFPKVRQIYVRRLSEHTAGNATGIGIAEYCHAKLLEQMNEEITRVNCLTSNHVSAGAIPISFPCDRDVLQTAVTQGSTTDPSRLGWMRIPDTLALEEVDCSVGYLEAARQRDDLEIIREPHALQFDTEGDLSD